MTIKTKINKLEKTRLKLFKQMINFEQEMDRCHRKELSRIQFKYVRTCKKLLEIEIIIKEIYPNITDEFDYIKKINYKEL